MVTMKQIAIACGISATAVSKALRDDSSISQKTIDKVKKVANEMGYSPNIAAVRLRTNRSYIFGILLQDATGSGVEHEFFATIINPFMKKAKESGYSVMFISDKVGNNNVTYTEFAKAYGLDGALVLTMDLEDDNIMELVKSSIPVVTVDFLVNDCSTVVSDNVHGMREMVKYAYEMGHRKIAFVHGEETYVGKVRVASFHKICRELELKIPPDYIKKGKFHDTITAEALTNELLDLKDPPTFIFYSDDFAFIGARNAIEQRNLTIPDDISVAGYDGFVLSQVIKPHLMTWKQNTTQIGQKAVELLVEAAEFPKTYLPQIVEVQGKLLKGESVKKII